ncbi:MAG: glycosyltransferase [Calditrichaceae bacterium]|nr:glycosyltransferase [Calditrichaceae bacterium]MBN2707489.1 glycosyltransferase [Calditrichaceae bacterium]RQV95580.1 MAG: glycosyltransferase [Calditrichota bacterium]
MNNIEVSIIIIAYNEQETIGTCIKSLIEVFNSIEESYEIILIDSGSSDDTIKIAQKYPIKIFKYSNGEKNASISRYFGLNKSFGKYILHVDGDIVIDKNWIVSALNIIKNNENLGAIGGYLSEKYNDGSFSEYRFPVNRKYVNEDSISGLALFRKDAIIEAGNWNINLRSGEEVDLSLRIMYEAGYDIWLIPQRMGIHYTEKLGSVKNFYNHLKSNRLIATGILFRLSRFKLKYLKFHLKRSDEIVIQFPIMFAYFSSVFIYLPFILIVLIFDILYSYSKRGNIKQAIIMFFTTKLYAMGTLYGFLCPIKHKKIGKVYKLN